MPLQIAWAAASAYCTHHEEGKAAQHFGHHADEHDIDADDNDSSQSGSQNGADNSHGYHHHGETMEIMTPMPLSPDGTQGKNLICADSGYPANAPPARIERPKWSALA